MMIARTSRVNLFASALLTAVGILSATPGFAQGNYSNPRYQGATPKKGDAVQVPSYSTPAGHTGSAPASNSSQPAYWSENNEPGATAEHRMELGVNLRLPIGVGDAGGSLKPRFGGDVQLYLQPLISNEFRNYVSIGWDLFQLKSDQDSKLHVIPFAVGVEFAHAPGRTFNPKFGAAIGGAYAWLGVPNSQTINGRGYFLAQVKPGLDISLDGFTVVLQTPISYLIGTNKMTYLAYSVGARFGL